MFSELQINSIRICHLIPFMVMQGYSPTIMAYKSCRRQRLKAAAFSRSAFQIIGIKSVEADLEEICRIG